MGQRGSQATPNHYKQLSPAELAAEQWGYGVARTAGVPTAECLGVLGNGLVIEMVPGLSCFRAINVLRSLNRPDAVTRLLDALWNDVSAFQYAARSTDAAPKGLVFAPYDVRNKLLAVSRIIDAPGVAAQMRRAADHLADWFAIHATMPFRDANPKNCLLYNLSKIDPELPTEAIIASRKHIDFRSMNELTTPADDFLSIILHPRVPATFRERRMSEIVSRYGQSNVTVTCVVRLARLWGRRYYYRMYQPDLYEQRYQHEGDTMDHFRSQLDQHLAHASDLGLI
jgi:hypothetical protein